MNGRYYYYDSHFIVEETVLPQCRLCGDVGDSWYILDQELGNSASDFLAHGLSK